MENLNLDEKSLKATHRQKELFSFSGKLARKSVPKRYSEEKKPAYWMNYFAIVAGNIFRIAAAFFAVYFLLKGVFALLGDFAAPVAGLIAFTALFLLEWRQWHNATGLLERWFFQNDLSRGHVITAVFFSLLTVGLGVWGLPYTVAELSPGANTFRAEKLDESDETAFWRKQVQDADEDAKRFFSASSYLGKLDTKNQGRYNKKLETLRAYRDSLSAAVAEVKRENKTREHRAAVDTLAAMKNKKNQDEKYLYSLIFLLLATEILFWLGFYHKERYEFLCCMEYAAMGKIKIATPSPTPSPTTGRRFSIPDQTSSFANESRFVSQNTVSNNCVTKEMPVTQTKKVESVIGSDDILKSAIKDLNSDKANLINGNGIRITVAGRLYKVFNRVGRVMENSEFLPSVQMLEDYAGAAQDVLHELRVRNVSYEFEKAHIEQLNNFFESYANAA